MTHYLLGHLPLVVNGHPGTWPTPVLPQGVGWRPSGHSGGLASIWMVTCSTPYSRVARACRVARTRCASAIAAISICMFGKVGWKINLLQFLIELHR